jgi:hypothetical protein
MTMPTNEQEEMATYLSELVQKTKTEKIIWNKLNPSTYMFWRKIGNETAKVYIQKVERKEFTPVEKGKPPQIKSTADYVFYIVGPSGTEEISFKTTENAFYTPMLSELFGAIEESFFRKRLNLFKEILKE